MVATPRASRALPGVAALILLIASGADAQLMARTQPPAAEKLADFEASLQSWLVSELSLQGVEVAATQRDVSVGFELTSDDPEEIVSQILLVALEVGPAARWAGNLRISPSIAGHPAGVVTVPVDAIRRLANGEIDQEAFLRTWQTEMMPVLADYPADLLGSLATNQGWTPGEVTATDGLAALVQFGLPEVHERLPENHPAAVTTVQTGTGQLQVAIIEVGDEAMADALLRSIAAALGPGAASPEEAGLTITGAATRARIRRDGGLLYIASGSDADTTLAINTLLSPPIDATMLADAGGGTAVADGGTPGGGTVTPGGGTDATGGGTDATGGGTATPGGGQQATEELLFADGFEGSLSNWDTSMVAAEAVEGALYFTVQGRNSLILRQTLPMDNVAIEFRGLAETNGIQVYLMKTQNEHYGWALGMGGNQHSLLVDDASGQALETVMGAAYTPGQWHTYRVVRRGSTLEAWRDGRLIISSAAAKDYSGEGMLVFSTQDARIGLDDVQAFRLLPPGGAQIATGGDPQTGGGQTGGGEAAAGPYQPMPLAPDGSVKKAVVCLGFDDRSGLRGVQDVFPAGTEKVALYMEIEDARPNSEIEMTWQRDGHIIGRQLLLVSGSKKNLGYLYARNRPTLWEGHYAVDIEENDRLIGRVTFTVGNP